MIKFSLCLIKYHTIIVWVEWRYDTTCVTFTVVTFIPAPVPPEKEPLTFLR